MQNINLTGTPGMPAYPVYGLNCPGESALAVKHADGNMTLQMEIVQVKTSKEENAEITAIELKDKVYPFYVNVYYKAYQDADVIEIWTEIRHQEKKPVILNQFASAFLPIRRGNVWLSHLYGSWANEGRLCQEALEPGMKVIKNKDGVRNSHTSHAEVMFSLDGKPQENAGCVIGAALCYSGNYKLRIDTHDDEYHRFFAGINEENSAYSLKKDEIFRTPELALTYSNEGLSGSSRNFHRWARLHKLAHGTVPRKILLNSWEGVYFDVNQAGMDQMMSDIASMGGELFVMDDGWFGDKYPRKNDSSSLGDWVVDKNKLPNGIEGLLKDAQKNGVKFGIWIEPEMANTTSEFYEKHPDWVIKAPERDVVQGRGGTQVVLDLANPQVQEFIFKIVDDLMSNYPEIDYIKWDANMSILNHGSNYLTKDNQSHMYIEFHRGFEKICQRIRAKYPDLTIQACASGGGRVNYGILPYFDEFWVSDNTDGMIDKILDNIPDEAIMYLINAVSFDAEWGNVYKENDIADGKFTNSEDKLMNVTMMHSTESIYLESDGCKGFIKQYKGGKYSFAALLPDNDIASFISSLSGEKLCRILSSTESCSVETKLPKFSNEYSDTLNNALSQLGMPTAFDENNADFSGIGKSTVGNISIGKVIHKTKIEVNEKGTKAGAAALVEMVDNACAINEKQVILDRPFMYMILDNETMLPLFAGIYTGV